MIEILPSLPRQNVRRSFALLTLGLALIFFFSAATVQPSSVTLELVEAAKKEGKVVFYTSTDIQAAEGLAKAFEAKYPGVRALVERTGAERVFQRIVQEYASNIHAVDAVESTDIVHFIFWKRQGWLADMCPRMLRAGQRPRGMPMGSTPLRAPHSP